MTLQSDTDSFYRQGPIRNHGFGVRPCKFCRLIYRIDRREFALSIVAMLGVVAVGAIRGILFAAILAILRFIRLVSRPRVEILGKVKGFPGLHSVERHPEAMTIPGLMLIRFNAPIVFFNAPFFKREVLAVANSAPSLKWLVVDMLPVTMIDATGLYTVQEVAETLRENGVVLAAAGRQTEWRHWAESPSRNLQDRRVAIFPTFGEAIRSYWVEQKVEDNREGFLELA